MLSVSCLSVLSVTFEHCGQTVRLIKTKLGTQVGLGPGHIVLDGDLAPLPQKYGTASNFRPMPIVAKRLNASGYHLLRR